MPRLTSGYLSKWFKTKDFATKADILRMRSVMIILRVAGFGLFLALLTYFVVRESEDRWLTSRIFSTPSSSSKAPKADPGKPGANRERPSARDTEMVARDQDETGDSLLFGFDAKGTQTSIEEDLVRTQAALAQALETRLLQNLETVQGAYVERGRAMAEVRDTVSALIAEVERDGADTSSEMGLALAGIAANLTTLTESKEALDRSLVIWSEAFHGLNQVEAISSAVGDERNYNFVEYEVGYSETLPQIARKLEFEYNVEHANLIELIPIFNQIDFQIQQLGGRRATTRIVANQSLRIPLPKTSGELLDDQQVGLRMQSQRASIESAKRRQAAVQTELGSQIALLRKSVQRMEELRVLTGLITASVENLDGGNIDDLMGDNTTPEQRAAWDRFNEAFRQYRVTPNAELQNRAKRDLKNATRALLDAYTKAATSEPAPNLSVGSDRVGPSDLDWLEKFIQRYEPK